MNIQSNHLCDASAEVLQHLKFYEPYFKIDREDDTPASPADLTDAFICGYVNGCYKTHAYSRAFFLKGESLRLCIFKEIVALGITMGDSAEEKEFISDCQYYLEAKHDRELEVVKRDLPGAFITGYYASIHKAGKFDQVLFMRGDQARVQIYADLFSASKKSENSLRAAARINANQFISKKERARLRAITFDTKIAIDNEGNSVPTEEAVRAAIHILTLVNISKEKREQLRAMLFDAETINDESSSAPLVSDTSGSIGTTAHDYAKPTGSADRQHPVLDSNYIVD